MDALEFGGAIAVALALVEVVKIMFYKYTEVDRRREEPFPSADGYVKEAVWRDRIGKIINEQHKIIEGLQELLQNQNKFLHKLLDLMITLDDRSKTSLEKIESLEHLTQYLESTQSGLEADMKGKQEK